MTTWQELQTLLRGCQTVSQLKTALMIARNRGLYTPINRSYFEQVR